MSTGRVPATGSSPLTTKGDLYTYSTTQARLAVGTNGETLVADSSTSTGLRYQPPVNANPVLNSAFQIWQRGTSFTISGFNYVADRWQAYRAVSGYTVSRQVTNDTTNLPFIQYALRGQRDSGNSATDVIYLAQSFETVDSILYAGKTVTLSFYARAGANWSPTSGNLQTRLFTGTGTDQNVLSSGYTGSASPINQNTALTTTWTRYSYTATLATNTTEIGLYFNATPVGTAGAADYFEITGVQLEVGSVATPFKTNGATLAGELAACQRYYFILTNGIADRPLGIASYWSATELHFAPRFPVTMRTVPTLSAASGTNYYRLKSAGSNDDFNSFTQDSATPDCAFLYNSTEASGTAGYAGLLTSRNASASLAWSAEL